MKENLLQEDMQKIKSLTQIKVETKKYADAVKRYRGISKAPRLMPMQQN